MKSVMIKRISAFSLIISMIMSVINFCCINVSAADELMTAIYAYDSIYVRKDTPDTIYTANSELMQIDGNSGPKREAFMRFDLSEFEEPLSFIESIKFRLTTYSDSSNEKNSFAVYILPADCVDYDIDSMNYAYAQSLGITGGAGEKLFDSEQGVQKLTAYYTDDILPAIKTYIAENPDVNKIAIKVCGVYGSGYSVYGAGSAVATKPALILTYSDDAAKLKSAEEYVRKSIGTAVAGNLSLPEKIDEIDISWKSLSKDTIADDGAILKIPEMDETHKEVKIEGTYSIGAISNVYEYEFLVLKKASYPGFGEYNDGKITVSFDVTGNDIDVKGYLLHIPNSRLKKGAKYKVYAGDSLADSATAFSDIGKTEVNVSQWIEKGIYKFTIEEVLPETINEGTESFILEGVGEQMRLLMDTADAIDLGDLSAVTENLKLPSQYNGVDIAWSSGNREYLSDGGRIERPSKHEDDVTVALTGKFTLGSHSYEKIYSVSILKEERNNAFANIEDPNYISDEEFFGKWDGEKNEWEITPILRYDEYSDLNSVFECAKKSDYKAAKVFLLNYYRSRTGFVEYGVTVESGFDLLCDSLLEKIFSFRQMDDIRGSGEADGEWKWVSVELAKLKDSYFVIDSDMDGSTLEIASKESGYAPYLEITVEGKTKSYIDIGDTYISAGDNVGKNYGDEEIMYARESGDENNPLITSNTKRAYMRFDISGIKETPESIILKMYARTTGESKKKFYVCTTSNENTFDETELTWSKHYPQIFNYKYAGYLWESASFYQNTIGCEYEWLNYCSRLYWVERLLSVYKESENEEMAYEAMQLIMSQYQQHSDIGTYPRPLDSGWRTEYLCMAFFDTLDCSFMTPELLTAQLKNLYQHAYSLKDVPDSSAANQNSAWGVGFARICACLPEIAQEGWWQQAKEKLKNLFSDGIMNSDGSYKESSSNYISGVLEEIRESVKLIRSIDGEGDAYYDYFMNAYNRLAKYYFDMAMSTGNTTPYGDGSRNNIVYFAQISNEFYPNTDFEYFATGGQSGKEPDYTSVLYADKAIAFLRDDWSLEGLSATINADYGGSHCNYDDLALDVYAFGDALLIEAGGSAYSDGSLMNATYKKTISHNTIEIDGVDQKWTSSDNVPQKLELTTNKLFDFVSSGSSAIYPGFDVNRNVLFLHNSYWIVSDYIKSSSGTHTYKQCWHPDANNNVKIEQATKKAYTDYYQSANIKIIPSRPDELEAGLDKMYMAKNGNELLEDYVTYTKKSDEKLVGFDTVLYPDKEGDNTSVSVENIDMADAEATAMRINIAGNNAYYYMSYEDEPIYRGFDEYTTDAAMAYVETDYRGYPRVIAIHNGNMLKNSERELIAGSNIPKDFGAEWSGSTMNIYSSDSNADISGIKVYSYENISNVTFNGKEIEFSNSDGTISFKKSSGSTSGGNSSITPGTPSGIGSSGAGGVTVGATGNTNPDETEEVYVGGGTSIEVVKSGETMDSSNEYSFEDISDSFAANAIEVLYREGIVSGVSENLFMPNKNVTRAEYTAMLVRALSLDSAEYENIFDDVGVDEWYTEAVIIAAKNGIVHGTGDGGFMPLANITREEMAVMLAAVCVKYGAESGMSIVFEDDGEIFDWARDSVEKLAKLGIMVGNENNMFLPKKNATRAEAAVTIYSLMGIMKEYNGVN